MEKGDGMGESIGQRLGAGSEIRIDGTEIEAAGWYPSDDMPMIFQGNVSIAQWLIRDFLERHR